MLGFHVDFDQGYRNVENWTSKKILRSAFSGISVYDHNYSTSPRTELTLSLLTSPLLILLFSSGIEVLLLMVAAAAVAMLVFRASGNEWNKSSQRESVPRFFDAKHFFSPSCSKIFDKKKNQKVLGSPMAFIFLNYISWWVLIEFWWGLSEVKWWWWCKW